MDWEGGTMGAIVLAMMGHVEAGRASSWPFTCAGNLIDNGDSGTTRNSRRSNASAAVFVCFVVSERIEFACIEPDTVTFITNVNVNVTFNDKAERCSTRRTLCHRRDSIRLTARTPIITVPGANVDERSDRASLIRIPFTDLFCIATVV